MPKVKKTKITIKKNKMPKKKQLKQMSFPSLNKAYWYKI